MLDEAECRKWLGIGEKAGTLMTREHAMTDEDLAVYRETDWFKGIRWEGESQ
ncbi:MAG: hypothetical protein IID59_07165 [Proteobacteria bacterium]|nr:hypothetical protein [Pseudomonadota bacterium]